MLNQGRRRKDGLGPRRQTARGCKWCRAPSDPLARAPCSALKGPTRTEGSVMLNAKGRRLPRSERRVRGAEQRQSCSRRCTSNLADYRLDAMISKPIATLRQPRARVRVVNHPFLSEVIAHEVCLTVTASHAMRHLDRRESLRVPTRLGALDKTIDMRSGLRRTRSCAASDSAASSLNTLWYMPRELARASPRRGVATRQPRRRRVAQQRQRRVRRPSILATAAARAQAAHRKFRQRSRKCKSMPAASATRAESRA